MAIVCGVALKVMFAIVGPSEETVTRGVYTVLFFTMLANLALCMFNLLPLFPLDGHHVVRELLPREHQGKFMAWQVRYGSVVLAVLIFLPRIMEMVTQKPTFSPIRWFFLRVAELAIRVLDIWGALGSLR